MKKNITISLAMSTLFIFSACGNDSSSSGSSISDLKSRDVIIISQNYNNELCTHSKVKENTHGATIVDVQVNGFIDRETLKVKAEDTLVTCAKYNRQNDYAQCALYDEGKGTGKTCVVAFNYVR